MMQASKHSCRHRGFTLIELMVVIAIIGILIALLMPAFARTKFMARTVVCINDKRQIVGGLINFAGDNKGAYPWYDGGGGIIMNPHDHNVRIIRTLHDYYGIGYGMWECAAAVASLGQREAEVSNSVASGYSSGTYKWITGSAVSYWVEQGGANAYGTPCWGGDPAGNNIAYRYTIDHSGSTAVVADQLDADLAGNVWGAQHAYRGVCINSPVAFADGHVQLQPTSVIRRRYWYSGYSQGY